MLKMLRFSFRVRRINRIRNEDIKGKAQVELFGNEIKETRLRGLDMCRGGTVGILHNRC